MRPILVLILALFAHYSSANFGGGDGPRIGFGLLGGKFLPHKKEIKDLVETFPWGCQVELNFQTSGEKDWHHYFNFPRYGVNLSYFNLGSPHLGHAFASNIFYDLPLNPRGSLGLIMGIGPGFITKPYREPDNIEYQVIGTHINAHLSLSTYVNVNLSERYLMRAGLGMYHFSNGSMKKPNSGVNYVLFNLSVSRRHQPPGLARRIPSFIPESGIWRIGFSYGRGEEWPINSGQKGAFNVFTHYEKRLTPKSSVGIEGALNYYANLEKRVDQAASQMINYRASIAATYKLHFGNLGYRTQFGVYIFPPFDGDGYFFLRNHLVYDFERVQVFAGLISHWAVAQNLEIGTAIRLNR
jgi:hypothetical protein